MSKNNNKTKITILLSFMLIMSGLLLGACSKVDVEDTNEEVIKKVLKHQFTGPDEKFIDLSLNPKYTTVVNNKAENKEFNKHLEKVYGPYFIDSYLDSFIATFGMQYQGFASFFGYKLSLKDITIEQGEKNSNRYTFIAKVGYKKSGDEEKTANVEGEVVFSTKKEGKIEGFQYKDDNGLSDILRN
ncbi:hypothetical protein [Bacillus sp. JJ722]|uniref:hypothetical protein n=1 Tax=Bacillus sp. JJ722 TaxID=3122973 RepID=UPI00300043A2